MELVSPPSELFSQLLQPSIHWDRTTGLRLLLSGFCWNGLFLELSLTLSAGPRTHLFQANSLQIQNSYVCQRLACFAKAPNTKWIAVYPFFQLKITTAARAIFQDPELECEVELKAIQ